MIKEDFIKYSIRDATEDDAAWIKKLYAESKKELGSFNLFMSWDNYLRGKGFFKVIEGKGFVRYEYLQRLRMWVLQEIAVATSERGNGIGKILCDQVPKPYMLKCNQSNAIGNAFYKKIGLKLTGTSMTRKGVPVNIYLCAQ